jgi:ABC-type transporter Mla MlaB component
MLKICFSETPSEERWILHGQLTDPWVRELRASWKKYHRREEQRACIVDLNDITFIDKSGERLLRSMLREGAQYIANGVYIKHVLERLTTRRKASLLNRLTGFLFSALLALLAIYFGAQWMATGVYFRHFFQHQLTTERLRRYMTSPQALEKGSSRHGGAARTSRGLLTAVVSS